MSFGNSRFLNLLLQLETGLANNSRNRHRNNCPKLCSWKRKCGKWRSFIWRRPFSPKRSGSWKCNSLADSFDNSYCQFFSNYFHFLNFICTSLLYYHTCNTNSLFSKFLKAKLSLKRSSIRILYPQIVWLRLWKGQSCQLLLRIIFLHQICLLDSRQVAGSWCSRRRRTLERFPFVHSSNRKNHRGFQSHYFQGYKICNFWRSST